MNALAYVAVLLVSALLFTDGKFNLSTPIVEILPNLTNVDGDIEHRMAYWREDLGMTRLHWHWHLCHPHDGPLYLLNKDKAGELFYYFHQQILARYNVERQCLGMNFVESFSYWETPIPVAYFPMLTSDIAGNKWSSRLKNMILRDTHRASLNETKISVDDLKLSAKRILKAVDRRKIIHANGTEISIDNDEGINILGILIETKIKVSPNYKFYGSLHDDVHTMIASVHDPKMELNTPEGVMTRPFVAIRDPIFFNWHNFLNDIFLKQRNTQKPYGEELSFPEVQVKSIELCSHQNGKCRKEKNTLHTYMMKSDINMSRGIDNFPRKPFLVRVIHLNHDEFDYTIEYVNSSPKPLLGTVRLFLFPIIRLGNVSMNLTEQRFLNIEMDRFVQPLQPGLNKIVRRSTMSSLTIPFEQTFRDLDTNRPRDDEYAELDKFNACGCGWPHHMLVPRGTSEGYPMLLFAIITDYSDDQTSPNEKESENNCKIGTIICSPRYGKKFPYKHTGGFPFDRPMADGINTIEDLLKPNMAIKPVTIYHSDEVRRGQILSYAEPTISGRNLTIEKGEFVTVFD